MNDAGVAQLVRASAFQAEGRGFESRLPLHFRVLEILDAAAVAQDPAVISYGEILDVLLGTHDPTQLNRQGNDIGTQYRSAIFPLDEAQRAEAVAAIERWNGEHPGQKAVTTIEGPAVWYPAEGYHQEYWEGEGQRNPYCLAVIPPKLAKLRKSFQAKVKA